MEASLGAPVEKDAFLEILSKRERTVAASSLPGEEERHPEVEGQTERSEEERAPDDDEEKEEECEEEKTGEELEDQRIGFASPSSARQADLRAALKPGGILSTYRSGDELQASLSNQRQVKAMEKVQHDYASKVSLAEDAKSVLHHEEEKLRALKKEAARPGASVDLSRLTYQEGEVGKAWSRLTSAEKQRDLAELALHKSVDAGNRVGQQAMRESVAAAAIAGERQRSEVSRAKRAISKERAEQTAAIERARREEAERLNKTNDARKHQTQGVLRLKATQAEHAQVLEEADKVRESHFQHDAQRLLTLKGSIDKVNRQVRTAHEARQKKQANLKMEQSKRFNELLEAGLNPHEVYRREEMQADKEHQRQELAAKQQLRSEKLLEQMMEEDKRYKKTQEEEKVKRRHAESFQAQKGNKVEEKRVAAYIRKMTIGSVDVLDPTGTAIRIDPSRVTMQRTSAFGLGRARPQEIENAERDLAAAKSRAAKWRPPRGKDDAESLPDFDPPESDGLGGGASEASPDGKLWVPSLTKLEEQYLAAARERQKANMTSVQRCWGREFKGDAFLAKPSVIAFSDFEVGKKYRQVVEVTNVSLTFNQFKLLPLEDRVKEFFDVEFVPPGRVSAGVTRYITIWFSPRLSSDIETTFPILAKTGRIDFPLRCTTKKTVLTITPQDQQATPEIDFGQVLLHESSSRTLYVKNSGALSARYTVHSNEETDDAGFLSCVDWEPSSGDFSAHATTEKTFTFKPKATGSFSATLRLSISNSASGDALFEEEQQLVLRGSCLDLPIFVEKPEYDFRSCIYGHIFRESIVLHNRQLVPMRIQVQKPAPIEGELQLTPTLAFMQGHGEQAIQIKFSPKEGFLDRYPDYRDSQSSEPGAFRIPVRIVGADQVMPIRTVLVGRMTTNSVSFEPLSLLFGRCFVGSSVSIRLAIINESTLPQQFAFSRLPSFLSVADIPSDVAEEDQTDKSRFGTAVLDGGAGAVLGCLLPQERREVCVTYTPDSSIEMRCKIPLRLITGSLCVRENLIECRGQGCPPLITLSHTQLDLASVPCGAVSRESVVLTNVAAVPYAINVLVPPFEISALKINPVCCVLAPKESRRIQIDFLPAREYVELLRQPLTQAPDAEGKASPAIDAAGDDAAETAAAAAAAALLEGRRRRLLELREHGGRRWERLLPADPRVEESRETPQPPEAGEEAEEAPKAEEALADGAFAASDGGGGKGDKEWTVHSAWKLAISMRPQGAGSSPVSHKATEPESLLSRRYPTTYLGLRTCVVPTVLRADPSALDFGEVTAQERRILALTIHNLAASEGGQQLRLEALPENACFKVLNAPRDVGTKPFQLMIEFNPELVQIYQTELRIFSQNSRVLVPLNGKGVRPVLQIEPDAGERQLAAAFWPEGAKDGVLHLGALVYNKACKDHLKAKFKVMNKSPYELTYRLRTVFSAEQNHVGVQPFTLSPATGVVEANGHREVTVTFRPHRPLAVFREKVFVEVPNQPAPTYLHLYGHCFSHQAYAIQGFDFGPFSLKEADRPSVFVDALAVGVGAHTSPAGELSYPKALSSTFSLVFERGERSKFLLAGACAPPGTPSAPQNAAAATFDFQILPSEFSGLFTVEAPEGGKPDKQVKGPLTPAKHATRVVFRYNPPAESGSLTIGDVTLDQLTGIGQWITCKVKAVLAGGFVPPEGPNTQEISVELKAYLQQC